MNKWLWDAIAAAGLLLLTAGLAAVYWPLALVTLGLSLLALGFLGARAQALAARPAAKRKGVDDEG